MTPSVENRRPENLALHFQEVLTAIERLRGSRQGVSDANAFRHHAREALRTAAGQALAAGYTAEDVKYATYATVAFLDESVLNSRNPVFADWARKPLQDLLPRRVGRDHRHPPGRHRILEVARAPFAILFA